MLNKKILVLIITETISRPFPVSLSIDKSLINPTLSVVATFRHQHPRWPITITHIIPQHKSMKKYQLTLIIFVCIYLSALCSTDFFPHLPSYISACCRWCKCNYRVCVLTWNQCGVDWCKYPSLHPCNRNKR